MCHDLFVEKYFREVKPKILKSDMYYDLLVEKYFSENNPKIIKSNANPKILEFYANLLKSLNCKKIKSFQKSLILT